MSDPIPGEGAIVMSESVVIIPAYQLEEKLIHLLQQLRQKELEKIIIVNDGSGEACLDIFRKAEEYGTVVTHDRNRGKGAALKTGIRTAIELFGKNNSYITADADGQHLPDDIRKIADVLQQNSDVLVLGIRDFKAQGVPLRSLLGNRFTSAFFRLTNGVHCSDTQTGLRGIPGKLEALALQEDGDRYEYEMNFLMDAAAILPFHFIPIQTVYQDGNQTSHFRPLRDSLRVYGRFLRFAFSSLTGAAVDFLFFIMLTSTLMLPQAQKVFLATVLARIISGVVNFFMNHVWSFHSTMPVGGEAVRYLLLFLGQMLVSAACVSALSFILPDVAAKILVDCCLFFISFIIQKNWVFNKNREEA